MLIIPSFIRSVTLIDHRVGPIYYILFFLYHKRTAAMTSSILKGLAQAKIIKKSVILFRVLNMTI